MNSLFLKCLKLSTEVHTANNQKYDGLPYTVHLTHCLSIGYKFIGLIPSDKQESVLGGILLHDSIEDGNVTYNDILHETNEVIAEIAYALTNEKGKNRKERANEKYYQGIRENEFATFVKLCDRIANIEYSKSSGSRMFEMYKREHPHFKELLYNAQYDVMFDYIETLFLE